MGLEALNMARQATKPTTLLRWEAQGYRIKIKLDAVTNMLQATAKSLISDKKYSLKFRCIIPSTKKPEQIKSALQLHHFYELHLDGNEQPVSLTSHVRGNGGGQVFSHKEQKTNSDSEQISSVEPVEMVNLDSVFEIWSKIHDAPSIKPGMLLELTLALQKCSRSQLQAENILPQLLNSLNEKLEPKTTAEGAVPHDKIAILKALTYTLNAMIWANIKKLSKEALYDPLKQKLEEYSKDSNNDLSFQAKLALEALRCIGSDVSFWDVSKHVIVSSAVLVRIAIAIYRCDPEKAIDLLPINQSI